MSDSVRGRFFTLLPILALIICSVIVIKTGDTQASLKPALQQKKPSNERKLIKPTWRNEPVKVKKVKVKKGFVTLGRKFTDDDDNWLEGLTLTVKNTSQKDIVFVDISLTLFSKEGDDVVDDVPVQFPFTYGSDTGMVGVDSTSNPIKPGGSVDITLSENAYIVLKEGLASTNYPLKFRHVELRVDAVLFADDTLWRKGSMFLRDPNDPGKWIRADKLNGQARKRNKTAAPANDRGVARNLNSNQYNGSGFSFAQFAAKPTFLTASMVGSFEPLASTTIAGATNPLPTPTPVQDCTSTGTPCARPPGCYELDSWDTVPCSTTDATCALRDDEVQGNGEGGLKLQRMFCRKSNLFTGVVCETPSCTCEFVILPSCQPPSNEEECQNQGWFWNFTTSQCNQEPQTCGGHCAPYWPLESGACEFPIDYCAYQWGCGFGFTDGGAGCCCLPTPILIDIDGNGIDLTDAHNGVHFDMGGDGHSEPIAWTKTGSDDAWLVLDRNGNGQVDNAKEMFGNFTDQPLGTTAFNGFLALAVFDQSSKGGNGDGQIDARDSVFGNLRLWQDKNRNGVSEANELYSLPSLRLASIEIDFKESKKTDASGNSFRYRAKVKDRWGSQMGRWAWDVILSVNPPPLP